MKPEFGQPSPEAGDYSHAIMLAIEATSKMHGAMGKPSYFMDPMSAIIGVLGSFIAGAPEQMRPDVTAKVHKLIDIAVQQSLEAGSEQTVRMKQ